MAQQDRSEPAVDRLPAAWSDADRQLLQRAVAHVRRAGEHATSAWQTPLRDLLLAHRASDDAALSLLADTLARACMGSHHLWQDLGLHGRDEVSRLMLLGFPVLFRSNRHELRWKRHLFLCLGQALGRADLKPPKCDHCDLYARCMGAPAPPMDTIRIALAPDHDH